MIDLPWLGTREIGNSGFRFARIDLVSKGVLSLESVRAIAVMRPMAQLGSFTSNDERLNQVWATAARTLHLCCQEYIWDGIKRDRLVWMGDMHPEVCSLMAVFGRQDVLPASLDYMQATTPAEKWMNTMPSYTLWWIAASTTGTATPATSPTSRPTTTTSRRSSPTWSSTSARTTTALWAASSTGRRSTTPRRSRPVCRR